ncbi:calcium-binding protein [Marinivivus vitaminiproducens]|uniref:calcium-binding protein n=1 Tax=Marinivivus vitaminiproducens TaxID=3035935 RepID=UPI00279A5CCE|nr:calcium-binding protein [Geminicoccaceae bacterium SCSIO 64248]
MEFKTSGTFDSSSRVTHPDTGESISLEGKAGSGTVLDGGMDGLLTGDSSRSNFDDAIIYDLTLASRNALRFTGFTSFDLGLGDDVLDLTARPGSEAYSSLRPVVVDAGPGDDVVWTNASHTELLGDGERLETGVAGGADQFQGGDGGDSVIGDATRLDSRSRGGSDWLSGGRGDDSIYGDGIWMNVAAMGGDDLIRGQQGNDTLTGDATWLRLGVGGADRLYGGGGNDQILGDSRWLQSEGVGGADRIHGGRGDDTVIGDANWVQDTARAGNDRLNGGDGNDLLFGDARYLSGRSVAGDDRLKAGAGDDILYGDSEFIRDMPRLGNDTLRGGPGSDHLYGDYREQAGEITLDGGDDLFVFAPGDGADTINDFGFGDDRIDLTAWSFDDVDDFTITDNSAPVVHVMLSAEDSVTVLNMEGTAITLTSNDFALA